MTIKKEKSPLIKMNATRNGKCEYCDVPIKVGDYIYYHTGRKKASHFFCPDQGAR